MVGVFLVVFEYAIAKDYFRDENQFIASGKLLQSAGLLPYRDYPYFHLPNLVFAYALIDCFTEFSHLGARVFSVVCAWMMLVLLANSAQRWMGVRSWLLQLVLGVSVVLLLLPNPLFRFTSGLAWNHDAPVLLTLLAVLVFLKSADSTHSGRLSLAAGFLLGLAVGTRVAFLTAVVAFLPAYLFHPRAESARSKARLAALFCAGLALALLPSLLLFLLAPRQFIFGNLTYAGLNTLYRENTGFVGPMTFWGKLLYFNERFLGQPGNIVLLALWVFAGLCALVYLRRQRQPRFEFFFLLALPLSLLVGSFLPTPLWYQYFYAPLPFLVLATLYMLGRLGQVSVRWRGAGIVVFLCAALAVNLYHFKEYPNPRWLLKPGLWYPMRTRVLGDQIQQRVGNQPVLTLTPLFPLDGGSDIYVPFATGPFAWRVAPLVPVSQRQAFMLYTEPELSALLAQQPPGGVLTGLEPQVEGFLVAYAKQQGYQPVLLSEDLTLWLPK